MINSGIMEGIILEIKDNSNRFVWIYVHMNDKEIASIQYDTNNNKIAEIQIREPNYVVVSKVAELLQHTEEITKWIYEEK